MTGRLIRALQNGGVAAPVRPEEWGVWRHPDRRGRIIGVLLDREIERLQLRGHLKPLGIGGAPLIWSGPAIALAADTDKLGQPVRLDPTVGVTPIYIDALILKQSAPVFRAGLRRAVQAFRQDMQAAAVSSGVVTMNWSRFHAHDKAAGTRHDHGFAYSPAQRSARSRLAAVERAMPISDFNFLTHLVCAEASKTWLAKHHDMRVGLVDARALKLLRLLISVTDAAV